MSEPLEIERKFLIRFPAPEILERYASGQSEIEQSYLRARPGTTLRVRKRVTDGVPAYYRTEKRKRSHMTRVELETELTEAEYLRLLDDAEPGLRTIRKRRYLIPWEGRVFEMDLFPFWTDRAFLEIELESEDAVFTLPPFLTVLKEVTEDRRYTNRALAENIPMDAIE